MPFKEPHTPIYLPAILVGRLKQLAIKKRRSTRMVAELLLEQALEAEEAQDEK